MVKKCNGLNGRTNNETRGTNDEGEDEVMYKDEGNRNYARMMMMTTTISFHFFFSFNFMIIQLLYIHTFTHSRVTDAPIAVMIIL